MSKTPDAALPGGVGYFWLATAVCVGSALAHCGTSTMPFQVGALIDGGQRSAGEAGLFGFFEVGALALGMILIASCLDRVSPRATAVCGCALAVLGNVALYYSHTFGLQLLFAVSSGLGYGAVFAATVAAVAATSQPDRLYAIGNGGALILVVALMRALPTVAGFAGPLGIFVALAILALLCAPFFAGFGVRGEGEEIRSAAWKIPGAPGLLFAWAAFSTGTGALYAFSERIGKDIQLRPEQIAAVLSAGVLVGLIGTGAAAILGRNVNRALALVLGITGSGLACLLLGFAYNLTVFAAGVFAYWIFYMFLYCYLLGTAAVLDSSGKVGTLGGGVERLGYAVGAGVGGFLAEHTTYSATGVLGFVGCLLGLSVGFPSLFRALRVRGAGAAGFREPNDSVLERNS